MQADGEQGFTAAPYGARTDGTGRDQQYHESGAIALAFGIFTFTSEKRDFLPRIDDGRIGLRIKADSSVQLEVTDKAPRVIVARFTGTLAVKM